MYYDRYNYEVERDCIRKLLHLQLWKRTDNYHVQMHGGTKQEDICTLVKLAEEEAQKNKTLNLDTVVFFDEANTVDSINLIKEIICDGRLNGRLVSKDLKFIAACNPYRR